jgi:two-component system, OmpR family, phosphate regulon sensor histidine kinase PhoR
VATLHIGTVTGPAATVAVAVLMAALVIAALIVGMARILSLRRGNQIRLLQEAAGRYARGELELPFRLKGPPEIAVLAHALQTMAEQLQLRIRAIRHQRNELETILASMAEGVIVLDANRRIRSMNHAAATLLRVESVGSTGKSVIQHIRNAELDDLATEAMASGGSVEREITVYRDSPVHLRVHVTPLSREGETHRRGILIVASDITRIKQLQQMRKDFVANVSHELKTPITSIKGFVETLLDGGVDDPDQSQRFLQIILNHANRLNLIIEDLLSLSRLEQGRLQLRFEECDVEHLAAAALDVCAPAAKAKQIRVRTSHSGNQTVRVNPNLIEQALVNLLDNAVKYSDERSDVELELATDDQRFTVTVRDNGQGIPGRDLPRVFERFFRTDRARSRDLGGTGLGLAIVKHIARAHGGDVSVQSTLGEGSVFTVWIPQQPTAGGAAAGEHTAGRRVPVE